MNDQYFRIGTTYYKKSQYPTTHDDFIEILIPWSPELIRQDEGKNSLGNVEKFDGFTCFPENQKEFYKRRISNYYNTYHPLSKEPKEGETLNSLKFIRHIFGDQSDLGLDYLQLLYTKPRQILPILCLVSTERNTGKSTFLKWLKEIFEFNLTYLTNDSFASNFNSDWGNKLLICVDEVLFQTEVLTERIKYLSTTNQHKIEAKGKDRKEIEFFGKFILCSNNETSFIKIDSNEIRFWIRKVENFSSEDVYLLSKLIAEIPAFLFYIKNRKLSSEYKSRMWFTPAQIKTEARANLVRKNSDQLETEIAEMLKALFDSIEENDICFCLTDMLNFLQKFRIKHEASDVKKILKEKWKLKSQNNSNSYKRISVTNDFGIYINDSKGRYYTISRDFFSENFDDLMN